MNPRAPHLHCTTPHLRERFMPMEQEHRLEHVATMEGVHWINDSAATNLNSTWYALEATAGPIIWLAGGLPNHNDRLLLAQMVLNKVKALYAFGSNAEELVRTYRPYTIALPCPDLREAVISAHILAEPGNTVLLSPAYPSFDQYANMEQRGQHFKELVHLHCA